ncbi:MAG: hypothetical protein Q6370_023420, partial [Candidatus Sigynarchaeota archaeon]
MFASAASDSARNAAARPASIDRAIARAIAPMLARLAWPCPSTGSMPEYPSCQGCSPDGRGDASPWTRIPAVSPPCYPSRSLS